MIRCQKCNCPININRIFKWANSGVSSIKCNQCGNVIANVNQLFALYAISGIFGVIGVNFSSEISKVLLSFGVYLTEFAVVIAVIIFSIFLLYSMVVFTIKNNM